MNNNECMGTVWKLLSFSKKIAGNYKFKYLGTHFNYHFMRFYPYLSALSYFAILIYTELFWRVQKVSTQKTTIYNTKLC